MNDSKRRNGRILGLLVFFILCFFASFFLGRYPITPKELIEVVASRILPIEKTWTSAVEHVIFQVRLPRVLLAALIGAGLSCAGAAYQGIFQNPMVSPSVLGASAGAAFLPSAGTTENPLFVLTVWPPTERVGQYLDTPVLLKTCAAPVTL